MGKRIIQQRRGRGTNVYKASSHRFKGQVKLHPIETTGLIIDLIHCPGHSAPLMKVHYLTGEKSLAFAPEGIKVGDEISVGGQEVNKGNILALKDVPEGTLVHNLELVPGDGGKLVRAGGASAKVVARSKTHVRVKLPSNKEKSFLINCRAVVGTIAGSGRVDKPFLKAGTRFKKMKAKGKQYPKVCGISMNAVDHPFGGGNSTHKGRPTISSRHAPPGRKVGKIAPRRTGKRK